ncbi:uncharacterized protein LOC141631959 [Silene latifolia]|uniref:uncharacterized protein LOC141631959 n=1 Tax=Silene latifolia TaxID=37657 RepID=UPI003D774FC4
MDPIKYLFEKPVLNGRMSRWTLMLSEFNLKYVSLKVIKGRAVADFLTDNPIEETEVIDTWLFPDENVVYVENNMWDLYFDGASNYMGYGVGILLISPTGEHVPLSIKLDFNVTNNAAEYEACLLGLRSALDLGLKKLLVHGDSSLVINQVGGSWKIRSQSLAPYQTRIEELEKYFEDIRYVHLPRAEKQFADALSKLAALINIPDHIDSMPICVERRSSPAYVNVINDTEKGETEPWYTAILKFKETGEYPPDLDKHGKRTLRMYPPNSLRPMMGNCTRRRLKGFCCDASINRQLKRLWKKSMTWVEVKSYKVLKAKPVAQFIQNDIICRYGIPHEFISDHGTHFHAETEVIVEKYKIKHHKSSPYRPQTNGAVEAANKTVTTILRKIPGNYKEWLEKILFALWGYRTSIRTATGATPYYLVYGMEAVQPVELEVPSLRILLESQVPEADWVQARYDSLVMLDERRLNALYHVQLYQKRIERAFNKKVSSGNLLPTTDLSKNTVRIDMSGPLQAQKSEMSGFISFRQTSNCRKAKPE